MSRRTSESNKAILAAWNKEQELVREGKGTRDWTPEQQQDILDKGKAYDENGRAFEGQHMKSAEKYPEYQGDPENIQFLTRAEHLEAHDGNWQNPTNWYFNPVTKEKVDFGDGPVIPCKIIQLAESVVSESNVDSSLTEQRERKEQPYKTKDKSSPNVKVLKDTYKKTEAQTHPKVQVPQKTSNMFARGLKSVGKFIAEHPVESFEIVGVVIGGAAKAISSIRSRGSNSARNTTQQVNSSVANTSIVEKVARSLPCENDVSGHKQRYHTKNGVIWKNKEPYHRGGNNG